jgi:hypothetical protein
VQQGWGSLRLMALFSTLLGQVLPEVKGCPKSVATRELRNTAIELCKHAPIWTVFLDEIETADEDYELDLSGEIAISAVVHKIISITQGRKKLTPAVMAEFHDHLSAHPNGGEPVYFVSPTPNIVLLSPIPDDAYTLRISASLSPAATAVGMDDTVMNSWGSALVNGALHRLMRFVSTPWGNADLSSFYGNLFQEDKRLARVNSVTRHSVMSRAVKPRKFA